MLSIHGCQGIRAISFSIAPRDGKEFFCETQSTFNTEKSVPTDLESKNYCSTEQLALAQASDTGFPFYQKLLHWYNVRAAGRSTPGLGDILAAAQLIPPWLEYFSPA